MELNEKEKILILLDSTLEESIEETYKLYQSIKIIKASENLDDIYKEFQSVIDYFQERKKAYSIDNIIQFPKR